MDLFFKFVLAERFRKHNLSLDGGEGGGGSGSHKVACENIRFSSLFVAEDERRRVRRNGCFRRLVIRGCKTC